MSNIYRTTFYIGVTANLRLRVWQHINGEGSEFVKKYKLFDLVYYEHYFDVEQAIKRKATEELASRVEREFDQIF